MNQLTRQLRPAVVILVFGMVSLGVVYPLVTTLVSQTAFHAKANGSLIKVNGKTVGSALLGQEISGRNYFHGRPHFGNWSPNDPSGSNNLSPNNPDLLKNVEGVAAQYRTENGLKSDQPVPADAATESASGLDPEISIQNALLQAPRVAIERGLSVDVVNKLVHKYTSGRSLLVFGDKGVNVVELNVALDNLKN
jgi:K+-transporting ATPase ATPase C chain